MADITTTKIKTDEKGNIKIGVSKPLADKTISIEGDDYNFTLNPKGNGAYELTIDEKFPQKRGKTGLGKKEVKKASKTAAIGETNPKRKKYEHIDMEARAQEFERAYKAFLEEHEHKTNPSIADMNRKLGYSHSTTYNLVNYLKKQGRITTTTTGNKEVIVLKEPAGASPAKR